MLTDEEAEAIRKKMAEGWRGPILLRWLEQLLQDRDERPRREREAEPTENMDKQGRPWARPAHKPILGLHYYAVPLARPCLSQS